jgi:hypothetical protein
LSGALFVRAPLGMAPLNDGPLEWEPVLVGALLSEVSMSWGSLEGGPLGRGLEWERSMCGGTLEWEPLKWAPLSGGQL